MPLSKKRMRERKRQDRVNVKPASNLTPVRLVKPKIAELQAMIRKMETQSVVQPESPVKPNYPWYNPELHTTGDIVRMKVGNTIKVVTL